MSRSLSTPILAPATVALGLHPLPVASSLLGSVAYDHDRAILQLEFGSGAVYQYFAFPSKAIGNLCRQTPTAPTSIATFEAYSATFC